MSHFALSTRCLRVLLPPALMLHRDLLSDPNKCFPNDPAEEWTYMEVAFPRQSSSLKVEGRRASCTVYYSFHRMDKALRLTSLLLSYEEGTFSRGKLVCGSKQTSAYGFSFAPSNHLILRRYKFNDVQSGCQTKTTALLPDNTPFRSVEQDFREMRLQW